MLTHRMNQTTNALERNKAIRAYLETGKTDTCYPAWGGSVVRGSQEGAKEVRDALVAAVGKEW
jgi:hypothetical protein